MMSRRKKRDIVILHGWNLSGSRFAPLADVFVSHGYRVFTPDFPGFGLEKPPSRPWHVVDYAELLSEYFKRERITRPVIIGHSFGGRVALKYLELYPEGGSALVLSGTPGFSPVPKKKLLFFLLISKVGSIVFSIPPLSLFKDWARRVLYYIAGSREFVRAEGVKKDTFKHIVSDSLVSAMQSIRVPTLFIWGEYDVIVPVSIARQMTEVIVHAKLVVIPEADHGVPFREPLVFFGYVERFLESLV